jgi:hypothetical protein
LLETGTGLLNGRSFPHALARVLQLRRPHLRPLGAELEASLVPEVDAHGREFVRGQFTLQMRVDGRSVLVRLHAWPDRWVWVDARHSVRGGWRWEFTAEGRFLPAPGPRALCARLEQMLRAAHLPPARVPEAMHHIWDHALAPGGRRRI